MEVGEGVREFGSGVLGALEILWGLCGFLFRGREREFVSSRFKGVVGVRIINVFGYALCILFVYWVVYWNVCTELLDN